MKQRFLVMFMTVSDMPLEVCGCCETLTAEFTVVGNLLVNPVMLRKIIFSRRSFHTTRTCISGGRYGMIPCDLEEPIQ